MDEPMSFDDPRRPVILAEDLDTLDSDEIVEGYRDALDGFPCSGNRSRAYWHGWRNGKVDRGEMEIEPEMTLLVRNVVQRDRFNRLMQELSPPDRPL